MKKTMHGLIFVAILSCNYGACQGVKGKKEAASASQPAQTGGAAGAMQSKPAKFRHEYKQVESDIKKVLNQFDNPAFRKKYPTLNNSLMRVPCNRIDDCNKIPSCNKDPLGNEYYCQLPFFDMLAHMSYKGHLDHLFQKKDSFEDENPSSIADEMLEFGLKECLKASSFQGLSDTEYVKTYKEFESLSKESFLIITVSEKIASIAEKMKNSLSLFWTLKIKLPASYLKNTDLKADPEFWLAWDTAQTNADRVLLLEALVASFIEVNWSETLGTLSEFENFVKFIREQEKKYSLDKSAIKDIIAPLNKYYGWEKF